MKIVRFASASDGGSQFVELDMPIDNASTDAFGNTVRRSAILPAQSTMVTEMPEGFYQDWHPASRRQLLIVLSGTLEVETSDGKRHRCGSGEVFLADDVGNVAAQQCLNLRDMRAHAGEAQGLLAHPRTAGKPGAEPDHQASRRDLLDRRDGRGLCHRVAVARY